MLVCLSTQLLIHCNASFFMIFFNVVVLFIKKKGSRICPLMVHVQIFSNCLFLLARKKKSSNVCCPKWYTCYDKLFTQQSNLYTGLVRSGWPEHYGLKSHRLVVEEVSVMVSFILRFKLAIFSFLLFSSVDVFFLLKFLENEKWNRKNFKRHQK